MATDLQPSEQRSLRVLITNSSLEYWAGSELFVRDIGTELMRRGHIPVFYSPRLGKFSDDVRSRGMQVVDDLDEITFPPDIIHGQHHLETMTALCHFVDVPAISFCHGILPWQEMPPIHPRILRYVAMSDAIQEHMIRHYQIEPNRISRCSNAVDMSRFRPRPQPLPARPGRALVFSNQATTDGYAVEIREACRAQGITLDVIGRQYGTATSEPERMLGNYDLVFARGRAALESLAVGAAVICCDVEGLGTMVSSENVDWYRRYNFGLHTLDREMTSRLVVEEIGRFDPADAARVSRRIREGADLPSAVDHILNIYRETVRTWENSRTSRTSPALEARATADYLRHVSLQFREELATRLVRQDTQLKSILRTMEKSRSWRLTAPFRQIRQYLERVLAVLRSAPK